MEEPGDELLIAAIPSRDAVEALSRRLKLPEAASHVYLAYVEGCGCRFAGFLITAADSIDRLIAHCPVPADLEIASALWRREVRRQQDLSIRIARGAVRPGEFLDAIWLEDCGHKGRGVPTWVFSLCCIPLSTPWDGQLLHPRPFCPRLFESMAMQPEAPRWIMQRMGGELAQERSPLSSNYSE